MSDTTPTAWKLSFPDTATKKEYDKYFKDHQDQAHCKKAYEKDVGSDPLYHPTPKRIKKMEGKDWEGFFRYKKSNTRIIYYPESETKTVYTIETGTSTGISYKKKSKKK